MDNTRAPFHIVLTQQFQNGVATSKEQRLFVCRSMYAAKVALKQLSMKTLQETYEPSTKQGEPLWGGTDLSDKVGHIARYVEPGPAPQSVDIYKCGTSGWIVKSATQSLVQRFWIEPIYEYKPTTSSTTTSSANANSSLIDFSAAFTSDQTDSSDASASATETAPRVDAKYESPEWRRRQRTAEITPPTTGNVHDALMYQIKTSKLVTKTCVHTPSASVPTLVVEPEATAAPPPPPPPPAPSLEDLFPSNASCPFAAFYDNSHNDAKSSNAPEIKAKMVNNDHEEHQSSSESNSSDSSDSDSESDSSDSESDSDSSDSSDEESNVVAQREQQTPKHVVWRGIRMVPT